MFFLVHIIVIDVSYLFKVSLLSHDHHRLGILIAAGDHLKFIFVVHLKPEILPMKLEEYLEIKDIVERSGLEKEQCIATLRHHFPAISEDTLLSIYSLCHQRRIKSTFSIYHQREAISKYVRNFWAAVSNKEPDGFLCRMAKEINFPPSSLGRVILEDYLKHGEHAKDTTRQNISRLMKDPRLIENEILSREICLCIRNDDLCGPQVEAIKLEMGLRYERVLHEILKDKNIPYNEEATLRKHGYDKTPDFKLVCPIAVDGYVVNWIESKASFGDTESHSAYLEDQFWSYTNRFGPGMVIYWFGFIDSLNVNIGKGILLRDAFPENVITLDFLLSDEICCIRSGCNNGNSKMRSCFL